MKIKYDSKKVERISEEYVNVTLYLKGKVVYKATLPNENS
jgi:hypothetical protein